jgi:ABC transporter DrrB family efflux protein
MTALASLGWAVVDGWTLTRRALLHWTRQPGDVAIGLLFPVLTVVLFGYLLGGQMAVPEGTEYFDFLIPGMLALNMFFGLEGTMMNVATDAERGVTDRFRSMPIAPSAVVVGRAAADMLFSVAVLAVLVACGLAVGWRWHGGAGDALLAFGLLLLLRFAFVWVGIYLGLLARDPQTVVAVQILVWPVGFLSGAFVAPASMPGWLGTLAEWNPLTSTIEATRDLFGNPGWGGTSWVAQHAELMAVVWPLALVAVFLPLSVHRYRRLAR